jgi:hypothetical protein
MVEAPGQYGGDGINSSFELCAISSNKNPPVCNALPKTKQSPMKRVSFIKVS